MRKYEENDKIHILHLLSEFEFISYEFIFEIIEESKENFDIISELEASSLCERLGANGEYLRINDTVRDYLRRSKFLLPEEYETKLKNHVDHFLKTYLSEEKDLSDYFYSLKKALIDKQDLDFRYLIPSHFFKTMKELYDRYKRYDDVITLADRVLSNQYSLDDAIKKEIRSLLCLSLARSRKKESKDRFSVEVQKIKGPEHDFLLGFYYRLQGRPEEAKNRLKKALESRKNFSTATRELVQVLIILEDYEEALGLAKENYESNPTNAYHVHAYFRCLINENYTIQEREKLLEKLLNDLSNIKSSIAEQMYANSRSQFLAYIKSDKISALNTINDAIDKFSESPYPVLTKFEISEKFNDLNEMRSTISLLEKTINYDSQFYSALIRAKSIYLARCGKIQEAKRLLDNNIRYFPESYKNKILQKFTSDVSSKPYRYNPL